jgi:hypothetical protein
MVLPEDFFFFAGMVLPEVNDKSKEIDKASLDEHGLPCHVDPNAHVSISWF